jgi:hypothetical protein
MQLRRPPLERSDTRAESAGRCLNVVFCCGASGPDSRVLAGSLAHVHAQELCLQCGG